MLQNSVTEKSVVRSLRMSPELWAFVIGRAKVRGVNVNAWLVRCIEDARQRLVVDGGATVAQRPVKATVEGSSPSHPAKTRSEIREAMIRDLSSSNPGFEALLAKSNAARPRPGDLLKKPRKVA